MTLLAGRRILVTGVLTEQSIAWSVAAAAQRQGAEVLLTSHGRCRRLTERAARRLPEAADVLELDVRREEDHHALREELRGRWGGVDGAVHAIAHAPADALAGGVVNAPAASLHETFAVSVFSFARLARTLGPLMAGRPAGASLVGLDFAAQPAWPGYDWMGIAKTALRDVSRYVACELGGHGVRCNLVASGPLRTPASDGIPGWADVQAAFPAHAPLGWDVDDPSPVADAVVFLLSGLARAVSGHVLHADGGIHATGGFTPLPGRRRGDVRFTDDDPAAAVKELMTT